MWHSLIRIVGLDHNYRFSDFEDEYDHASCVPFFQDSDGGPAFGGARNTETGEHITFKSKYEESRTQEEV